MDGLLANIAALWEQGGFVAPPLLLCLLVLWYGLGYRLISLRRGTPQPVEALVTSWRRGAIPPRGVLGDTLFRLGHEGADPDRIDAIVAEEQAELHTWAGVVAAVVGVAPLLGLLGTVAGMIETFDSLADQALFSRGGGIAAGVSQALFTTQMGLVVAIPGAIVGRLLARRETELNGELHELGRLAGGSNEGLIA
jgi:biopolymer transport protein ExbB